jgi:hypothetical protein
MSSMVSNKSALGAFNASRSKLAKLPSLLRYVQANMDDNDFVIDAEFGGREMSPNQANVLRVYDKLTREERRAHFEQIALYMMMRYGTFTVEQCARDDNSRGIFIRVRG